MKNELLNNFLNELSEEDIKVIKEWLKNKENAINDNFKMLSDEVIQKFGYGIGDISYFKEFNNQDIIFFYDEFIADKANHEINDYINYFGKLFISNHDNIDLYEVVRFNEEFKSKIYNLNRNSMLKVPNFLCLKYNILDFLKRNDI